ncbi:MAG: type II toxin-antitoxin system YafQ family toxin [Syntrophaceae bacterium]|nr:type II toxin-antitoxin system YafQ family toxin [Syntrophaceae bacterium]
MVVGNPKATYTLVWTDTFSRTARKFLRRHPELTGLFKDILQLLETDPHAPRLHLHPLKGKHQGKHSVRINYEYRIVLILRVTDKDVIILDVGSHDEVYC